MDGSIDSKFDPDNEAVFSTRQLENASRRLSKPQNRLKDFEDDANRDMDVVASPSALAGSPAGTGLDPNGLDEASISIEIGRGKRNEFRSAPTHFRPAEEFSSHILNGIADDTKHSFRADENGEPQPYPSDDLFGLEEKENRRPVAAKTADHGSGQGSQASEERRRNAAQTRARTSDDEDNASLNSEGRPPTVDLTSRSTRFGRIKAGTASAALPAKGNQSVPGKRTEKNAFQGPDSKDVRRNDAGISNTMTTQLSYILPDLPNLTELVSGVYQDGTPVFSRRGPASSRFGGLNRRGNHDKLGHNHAAIQSIPVPSEERAILVSLRLLQDKVVELEKERASDERLIDDLQVELSNLKAEKLERQRRLRSDSALGMADSGGEAGDDMGKKRSTMAAEKISECFVKSFFTEYGADTSPQSVLQTNMKSLQERLDMTTKKLSTAEISVRKLTRERDAAVAQLGVAFCASEDLKQENDALLKENEALKEDVARLNEECEAGKRQWAKREAVLRKKVERRDEAVNEVREMTREIWEMRKPQEKALSSRVGRRGADSHLSRDLEAAKEQLDKQSSHHLAQTRCVHRANGAHSHPGAVEASVTTKASRKGSGTQLCEMATNANLRHSNVKSGGDNITRRSGAPEQKVSKKKTRKVIVEETIHSDMSESDDASMASSENVADIPGTIEAEGTMRSQVSATGDLTFLSVLEVRNLDLNTDISY